MTSGKVRKTIASLTGTCQVDMAIRCLGTLQRYSADPIMFQIHDDGSATADDCARLKESLNVKRIVGRSEADDLCAPLLARRPHLAAARRGNPLLLKLL